LQANDSVISICLEQARRDLNDPENAMIGAFAGAVTGVLTTPLDVIKTRLMVQVCQNDKYTKY